MRSPAPMQRIYRSSWSCGGPNTNDRATEHLVHHTLATHDFPTNSRWRRRSLAPLLSITSAADAPRQIDYAIRSALREKKPAYIEIACNIAAAPCAAPGPVSWVVAEEPSDPESTAGGPHGGNRLPARQEKAGALDRQQTSRGRRREAGSRVCRSARMCCHGDGCREEFLPGESSAIRWYLLGRGWEVPPRGRSLIGLTA